MLRKRMRSLKAALCRRTCCKRGMEGHCTDLHLCEACAREVQLQGSLHLRATNGVEAALYAAASD